jgi:peptidoglycan hydrolase-like protein with peptidoglycan-binding domain
VATWRRAARRTTPGSSRRAAVTSLLAALIAATAGIVGGLWWGDRLAEGTVGSVGAPVASPVVEEPTTVPAPTTPPATQPPPTQPPPTQPPTTTAPPATVPPTTEPLPAEPEGPAVDVAALQQRLTDLGYWLGTPDGRDGPLTRQAVMAFQKAEGLARDGIAGPATLTALETAQRPRATDHGRDHVEIDLDRQLLLVVQGGEVRLALNTSTGTRGWATPSGEFRVERQIDGIRRAPLGDLYRPKYFNGGIAVHGSPSIPGHPASHGCARVSNGAMDHLWATGVLAIGTPVVVR